MGSMRIRNQFLIPSNLLSLRIFFKLFKAPDKQAIFSLHEQISRTFKELNEDVDKLANSFLNHFQLKKGDVLG